jgi:multisubunit Na+/H+ antiporter MnhF subunit
VGISLCLTVIGLFRVIVISQHVDSIADNMLAFDALIFLVACFFAYLSLRSRTTRARHYERVADIAFLGGLALMVAIAGLIAYEIV